MTGYCILDVETGGLDPLVNPLLTLNALVVDLSLQPVESFEVLVQSGGKTVSSQALEVNGIVLERHDAIADSPEEAGQKFKAFMESHARSFPTMILVGHHIPFDMAFTEQIWPGFTKKYNRQTIDTRVLGTLLITQKLIPGHSASLQNLRSSLGIESPAVAHTGSGDIEITLELLRHFISLVRRGVLSQESSGFGRRL